MNNSKNTIQLYLASQSTRRKELLQQLALSYQVLDVDVDETATPSEAPAQLVQRLAATKATAGWLSPQRLLDIPVLGADTLVVLDQHILGKPKSLEQAKQMLSLFSGQTHQVLSAVALKQGEQQHVELSMTEVTMRSLSPQEITDYCQTEEPFGKAGAYAIQGHAAMFIEEIKGSYSGVVGLPIYETSKLLTLYHIELWPGVKLD